METAKHVSKRMEAGGEGRFVDSRVDVRGAACPSMADGEST